MTATPKPTNPLCTGIDRCQYQPDPAHGAPPPCWIQAASHRQRLTHAVDTLRYYAIAVIPSYDSAPDLARARIAQTLHDRYPHGTGCYLFWTAAADRTAFTADDTLATALTLYHSPDALPAISAALTMAGLSHQPGPEPHTLTLTPAIPQTSTGR